MFWVRLFVVSCFINACQYSCSLLSPCACSFKFSLVRNQQGQLKLPKRPVQIVGAASEWPAAAWNFSTLADVMEGDPVFVSNFWCYNEYFGGQQLQNDESCHEEYPVAEAFFQNISSHAPITTYARALETLMLRENDEIFKDYPELKDDLRFDEFMPKDLLENNGYRIVNHAFFAGPAGAHTGLHADPDIGTFLVHIGPGRKEVLILPPIARHHIGNNRAADGAIYPDSKFSNLFDVDVLEHLHHTSLRSKMYHAILHAGDILFLPMHWFHQVRYLDASMSVAVILGRMHSEH